MRILSLFLMLFLSYPVFLVFPVYAAESIPASAFTSPTLVWETFRGALRKGDFALAYRCFTASSQSVYPEKEFVREYHPIGVLYPLILSDNSEMRVQSSFNWAEIQMAVPSPSGKPVLLRISLSRENDQWRIVPGRRENEERIEAETRRYLSESAMAVPLYPEGIRGGARPVREVTIGRIHHIQLHPATTGRGPSFYRFVEREGKIIAQPNIASLRAFSIDAEGRVVVYSE